MHRLRTREREREQKKASQNSTRMRDGKDRDPPLALRFDAPAFSVPGEAGSSGQGGNEHLSPHRQQLGQRLYPRVRALTPVSILRNKISGVIPCQLIQSMALTIINFDKIGCISRTFNADSKNINHIEIDQMV